MSGGTAGHNWEEEERLEEDLVPDLEMLISLILDRLDESGDGKVDKKDLAARRRQDAERQRQAMLQRGASFTGSIHIVGTVNLTSG